MKRIPYILYLLLLVFCMGGCATDDTTIKTQISPGTKNQIIEIDQYDINMKFCLLNAKGEPSTVFTEGENFTVFFSLTNNREGKVYLNNNFPPDEIGQIYSLDGTSMGKADGFGIRDVKDFFTIPSKGTCPFAFAWVDDANPQQKPLPRGGYYVAFSYSFDLTQPESDNAGYKKAVTDRMLFKIYFTVH